MYQIEMLTTNMADLHGNYLSCKVPSPNKDLYSAGGACLCNPSQLSKFVLGMYVCECENALQNHSSKCGGWGSKNNNEQC